MPTAYETYRAATESDPAVPNNRDDKETVTTRADSAHANEIENQTNLDSTVIGDDAEPPVIL